jgi:hypothetical protein
MLGDTQRGRVICTVWAAVAQSAGSSYCPKQTALYFRSLMRVTSLIYLLSFLVGVYIIEILWKSLAEGTLCVSCT